MLNFQSLAPHVRYIPRPRMLVHSLSGEGYLNFEGNEFGHPEVKSPVIPWIAEWAG